MYYIGMQQAQICEICEEKKDILVPKAGSGVEVSYLCKDCIEERQIEILQEYIEKYDIKTEAL